MVDALLLVFREVLEAATLISLLLALCHKLQLNYRWVLAAIGCGALGSWLMAHNAYAIADAVEGAGQELLDCTLYLAVILCIISLSLAVLSPQSSSTPQTHKLLSIPAKNNGLIYSLLILTVSCSATREGSEIIIYLSSFSEDSTVFYSALIGGVIGAGIGISMGAIAYYCFAFMPNTLFLPIFLLVITLITGGLAMQIAKQLMQIGWLDSTAPIWDSSFLVSEESWLGAFLYALIGYDAKPTATQGIFYILAITPIVLGTGWHYWRLRENTYA